MLCVIVLNTLRSTVYIFRLDLLGCHKILPFLGWSMFFFFYCKTLMWHISNIQNIFFNHFREPMPFSPQKPCQHVAFFLIRKKAKTELLERSITGGFSLTFGASKKPSTVPSPLWTQMVCVCVSHGSYCALVWGPTPIRYPSISLTSALSPRQAFELNASGKALGQHKPPELQQ